MLAEPSIHPFFLYEFTVFTCDLGISWDIILQNVDPIKSFYQKPEVGCNKWLSRDSARQDACVEGGKNDYSFVKGATDDVVKRKRRARSTVSQGAWGLHKA